MVGPIHQGETWRVEEWRLSFGPFRDRRKGQRLESSASAATSVTPGVIPPIGPALAVSCGAVPFVIAITLSSRRVRSIVRLATQNSNPDGRCNAMKDAIVERCMQTGRIMIPAGALAAMAPLLHEWFPMLVGILLVLLVAYAGHPFPSVKHPLANVPPFPTPVRLLVSALAVGSFAFGGMVIWNNSTLGLRAPAQKVRPFSSSHLDVPSVYAATDIANPLRFSLRGESAYLLTEPPFEGRVAFVVDEVNLLKKTEVMVVTGLEKYPLLLEAAASSKNVDLDIEPRSVRIEHQKTKIQPGDILAAAKLSAGSTLTFVYHGAAYEVALCKSEFYVIGKNRVSVVIGPAGAPRCF